MTFGRLMICAMEGARNDNEMEEIVNFCSIFNDYVDEDIDVIKVSTFPKEDEFEAYDNCL